MDELHTQHEDVTGDATRNASSYLTAALAAAQKAADWRTARTTRRTDTATATADQDGTGQRAPGTTEPTPGDTRSGAPVPDALAAANLGTPDAVAHHPGLSADPQDPPQVRYAPLVAAGLPEQTSRAVLDDPAWPELAATLAQAHQAGTDPGQLPLVLRPVSSSGVRSRHWGRLGRGRRRCRGLLGGCLRSCRCGARWVGSRGGWRGRSRSPRCWRSRRSAVGRAGAVRRR